MARLRITHIEIEDASAEMMLAALAQLGEVPTPAAESLGLFLPQTIEAPAMPKGKLIPRPKKLKKPKREKGNASPAQLQHRQSPGGGDTIPARILDSLRAKPMSSLDLASALKLQPQQVYAPCSVLKGKGVIVSKNDEGEGKDGTRRWFVR